MSNPNFQSVADTIASNEIDTIISTQERVFLAQLQSGDVKGAEGKLHQLMTIKEMHGASLPESFSEHIEEMTVRLKLAQMKALTLKELHKGNYTAFQGISQEIVTLQDTARNSTKGIAQLVVDISAETLREVMRVVDTIRTSIHNETMGAIQTNAAVAPYITDYSTTLKTIEAVGEMVANDDQIQNVVETSEMGFEEAITAYTNQIKGILGSGNQLPDAIEEDYQAVTHILADSHNELATVLRMARVSAETKTHTQIPAEITAHITQTIFSSLRALQRETGASRGMPMLSEQSLHAFEAFIASFIEEHADRILPLLGDNPSALVLSKEITGSVIHVVQELLEGEYKEPEKKPYMTLKQAEQKASQERAKMGIFERLVYEISAEDIRRDHNDTIKQDNARVEHAYQEKVKRFKAKISGEGNTESLSHSDLHYVLHLAKVDPAQIQQMCEHLSDTMTQMQDANKVPTLLESLAGIDPKILEMLLMAGFSGDKINRDGFVLFCHAMNKKIGGSFLEGMPQLRAYFMRETNGVKSSIGVYLKNIKSKNDAQRLSSLVRQGQRFVALLHFMRQLHMETADMVRDIDAMWENVKAQSLGMSERDTIAEFYTALVAPKISLADKLSRLTELHGRIQKAFAVRVWSGDSKPGVVQHDLAA